MEIILDYREKKLIETCFSLIQTNENFNKIILKNENLHIGDIVIKHNNEVKINLTYSIQNTGINDAIEIQFT